MENRADDPLRDGVAIPSVMEKTAAGAPAQDRVQVCQPASFCMSEITWALLGVPPVGVGLGLAPGLGEGLGLGLAEVLVAVEPAAAAWPPHPASRPQQAARVRSRIFDPIILGLPL